MFVNGFVRNNIQRRRLMSVDRVRTEDDLLTSS